MNLSDEIFQQLGRTAYALSIAEDQHLPIVAWAHDSALTPVHHGSEHGDRIRCCFSRSKSLIQNVAKGVGQSSLGCRAVFVCFQALTLSQCPKTIGCVGQWDTRSFLARSRLCCLVFAAARYARRARDIAVFVDEIQELIIAIDGLLHDHLSLTSA